MHKLYSFIVTLFFALGVMAQEAEEPIIITAPDTTITEKVSYSFTHSGITVSCTQGSIFPADHPWNDLHIADFRCHAGFSISFSAEQPMKGLAINGWVKKNFTASCDNGILNYLSDDEDDSVGEPVLTVSDIDAKSVTISCDKQLRCFSVEVYFTQNPDGPQGEVMDTVRFTASTAVAQDYSDDPTYSQEGHYCYWLILAPESGYPQVWLDMYSAVKGDLSGTYSLYDFNVGEYTFIQLSESELDYEYAYDQAFTITKADNGYHIEGWIIADNDVQYEFVYDGMVEVIPSGTEGMEDLHPADVLHRKILHNGQVLIDRDGQRWTIHGTYWK